MPAAIVGVLARDFIKEVLFNPLVVCISLIVGGLVLGVIDGLNLPEKHRDATRFSLPMYFKIGVIQCMAMIPGVSRSGATLTAGVALLER